VINSRLTLLPCQEDRSFNLCEDLKNTKIRSCVTLNPEIDPKRPVTVMPRVSQDMSSLELNRKPVVDWGGDETNIARDGRHGTQRKSDLRWPC
jgi:hypothetical protein